MALKAKGNSGPDTQLVVSVIRDSHIHERIVIEVVESTGCNGPFTIVIADTDTDLSVTLRPGIWYKCRHRIGHCPNTTCIISNGIQLTNIDGIIRINSIGNIGDSSLMPRASHRNGIGSRSDGILPESYAVVGSIDYGSTMANRYRSICIGTNVTVRANRDGIG